ncbi:MAG: hypothetical protein RDU76_06205 [Candidatus Edwardsbacteria bacterium]|nr:hypothetical protein [Candidatus Edwardsbacteria bacterium]
MKNILLAFLLGLTLGASVMYFVKPGAPAVTTSVAAGSGTTETAEKDSSTTTSTETGKETGKITSSTTTVTVTGPGKRDTSVTEEKTVTDYTTFTEAVRRQTEATERQTRIYQEWQDSTNMLLKASREAQGPRYDHWLGLGLGGEVNGPMAWPWKPEEAYIWPKLRFGEKELRLLPKVGYNWKDGENPWRVGIAYSLYFR